MLYNWLISLPMMVCLFWTIFFLVRFFRGSDEPRIKWSILVFYLASTILYTNHWLYFSDVSTSLGAYTYLLANLSVYPLYYLYICALTHARRHKEAILLFFPAIIAAILFPLNRYWHWLNPSYMFLLARIGFAVQVIWVWIRGFRLLRTTQQRLDNTYADNRSFLLQPTHTLLVLIGITAVASTLLNILGRDAFDGSLLVCIPAVLMSALLYSLGYIAAHTTLPKETIAQEEPQEDKATTAETDELFYKISTVLVEEQLFANPNLTIQDVATATNSNRTYVSNCINRRTGLSFSQYVARYRVEYAQTILRDPQYKTDHDAITAAITCSGFSSNQNFYRVFKEITRITPLQYRQQNA